MYFKDKDGDLAANLPDELEFYKQRHGTLTGLKLSPKKFICAYADRYYLLAHATLPAREPDGMRFKLWVEVTEKVFEKFENQPEEHFDDFIAGGILANEWPGFEKTLHLRLTLKMDKNRKIYISEFLDQDGIDPLLYVALHGKLSEEKTMEMIKNLVDTWMEGEPN